MRRHRALWTLPLIVALVGCGPQADEPNENPTTAQELRSDKQRVLTPQVPPQDMTAQVHGNGDFAFDLYQQVRSKPGNLFYSPHSISIALAMLHAGARTNTETQMEQALSYVLPQSQLHPALNKLDQDLSSRGKGAKAADGKAFRLNIVNAIWGQQDYSFLPSYLDVLALNYGAGLRLLDFMEYPEDSRREINSWVERETENRIKDLLPQGSIDSMTRLVLTNAIYFNAAWAEPFEKEATGAEPFYLHDGGKATVQMMNKLMQAGYAEGADYRAAALPYDGKELSMVVIVPKDGKFDSFEQSLDHATVDGIIQNLTDQQVIVGLPKFEFKDSLKLKEKLQALGMTDAFSSQADLSGIDGTKGLVVSDVLHKSFIKVNEEGTEEAAATAVIVAGSAPVQHPELRADRPFIFLIRDHATGAILFVGRVVDPNA